MSYKAGFIGLIGQPNAGKSSLMNYLINQKTSIVTPKPQTTRRRILGIQTNDQAQWIFVDAPGIIKAEEGLNHFLEKEAEDVIKESDALLAILNLDENRIEDLEKVISLVKLSGKPWMGVITKTDIQDKAHRIMIIRQLVESSGGKCLQVSTYKDGDLGRTEILEAVKEILPVAQAPLYDAELYTTENMRELVSEIIRENCFHHLAHELPYSLAVQIREFKEDQKPCPHIYADVIVNKTSHKAIVIGEKAQMIKKISQDSRKAVEELMGQKVFLELNVVVKENWYTNNRLMKELKYVITE